MILDLFLIVVAVVSIIYAIRANKRCGNNTKTGNNDKESAQIKQLRSNLYNNFMREYPGEAEMRYRLDKMDEQSKIDKLVIENNRKQIAELEKENKELKKERYKREEELNEAQKKVRSYFTNYDTFANWATKKHFDRLRNALSESIEPRAMVDVAAVFISKKTKAVYETTLSDCTCRDHKIRGVSPCKHMYALAWMLGLIAPEDNTELKEDIIKYTELKEKVEKNKDLDGKKKRPRR